MQLCISVSAFGCSGGTVEAANQLQTWTKVPVSIELMPFRWENGKRIKDYADSFKVEVSCVHLMAWEERKSLKYRFESFLFNRFFGTPRTTRAFQQARELGCSVLLHGGAAFRLQHEGLLHRLAGLNVIVENGNSSISSYSDNGDRSQTALDAALMLREDSEAKSVSLCIDTGHLANEVVASREWSSEVYLERVNWYIHSAVRYGFDISRIHVHDWTIEKSGYAEHDHQHLGTGDLPLHEVVTRVPDDNQDLNICVEVLSKNLLDIMAMTFLPGTLRAWREHRNQVHDLVDDLRLLLEWTSGR